MKFRVCPKCGATFRNGGSTDQVKLEQLKCGRCYVPLVKAVKVQGRWVAAP